MSRTQDRATTERFTRTLRELVKQPDNKFCADCKHNDPRWASWNIGVFLCIRCSGIHRGMGTHISKVKSVDLDTWTPEQMESIQKWGNRRANLYWEARLKAGHVPPDHKMESFIRSKYESRRWAMDGPPPQDPSVLESEAAVPETPAELVSPPRAPDSIGWSSPSPPRTSASTVNRQPQPRQLLSAGHGNAPAAPMMKPPPGQQPKAAAPAPAPAQPKPQDDLFSLDFHAPAATPAPASPSLQKNAKNDIMSLFSTPAAPPAQQAFAQFQQPTQTSPWGAPAQQQQPQSMMGNNGTGMWGASSGWSSPQQQPQPQSGIWGAPQQPQQQSNLWGSPAVPQQNAFAAAAADTNIWGASPSVSAGGNMDLFAQPVQQPKKDDAFGDIWGGFK
ncbi:ArfGap-domain-containing protein [Mycena kentingensis (nom. inval.)]|nr:ArfGap-domain-containing protein [Mycena kentingensis (nom. inval.)]